MSVIATEGPGLAIWERTVQPGKKDLDRPAARALLRLRMSAKDLRRADQLAAKAVAGSLSDDEAQELESYRSVGTALELLKAKARLSLARRD